MKNDPHTTTRHAVCAEESQSQPRAAPLVLHHIMRERGCVVQDVRFLHLGARVAVIVALDSHLARHEVAEAIVGIVGCFARPVCAACHPVHGVVLVGDGVLDVPMHPTYLVGLDDIGVVEYQVYTQRMMGAQRAQALAFLSVSF